MRILHYNICNNFSGQSADAEAFADALACLRPDVVALNESRDDGLVQAHLRRVNYVQVVQRETNLQGNRNVPAVYVAAKHQGLARTLNVSGLKFRVCAIELLGTVVVSYHASPYGAPGVIAEVAEFIAWARDWPRCVVVGDCNSLARLEVNALTLDQQAAVTERYRVDDQISTEAIDLLLSAHFVDAIPSDAAQGTVPTVGKPRHSENGLHHRLDYAFTRGVEVTSVAILRDSPFDRLSDHYPLLLECTTENR